jgi:hypothetical protein
MKIHYAKEDSQGILTYKPANRRNVCLKKIFVQEGLEACQEETGKNEDPPRSGGDQSAEDVGHDKKPVTKR